VTNHDTLKSRQVAFAAVEAAIDHAEDRCEVLEALVQRSLLELAHEIGREAAADVAYRLGDVLADAPS
jgi:hypothetical protein